MRAVRGLLIPGALLFLTVTLPPDSAAQAPVEVNTCGQVVTGDGFLAADLDCSGFTGGLLDYGAAVVLSRGSTLDLGGFTLRGGQIGVICAKPCGGGTNTYIVDLGSLDGPVAISNSNPNATDSLIVNGAAGNNAITVSTVQVTAAGQATISVNAALAALTINGGSGDNQVTVSSLTASVSSSLRNDSVR